MKILQLCNKIPYPPRDGGAIAMLNMARSFAKNGHHVTVLAMNTSKHKTSITEIPDKLTRLITFNYIDVDTRLKPLNLLANLIFSKQPYNAVRFIDKGFKNFIIRLLQQEVFDIVQLEGLYLKPYIPVIRKYYQGIIAYRAHNVENEIWYRIVPATQNIFKRVYLKTLADRINCFEKDMVNQYDLLIPISDSDNDWFQKTGNNKPFHITPTGIPEEYFNPPLEKARSNDLFYIGALDWIPNQDALIWFTGQVWIPLKKKKPVLQFHIAGRNAPEWLARKFENSGITFHGEIENAHQFIDHHSIMVVPLFAGSGLRIKIIEAMARSKAIITTTIGAQGINAARGKEIIIANNASEFIREIDRLLDVPEHIYELEKNAYTFARHNFMDEQIVKNLLYFYSQHTAC